MGHGHAASSVAVAASARSVTAVHVDESVDGVLWVYR